MFNEIYEELDDYQDRLRIKFNEINARRYIDMSPNAYIEDTGRMFGLEECSDEFITTRINIEAKINKFLEESMDGLSAHKIGLLEDEINVLKNKLTLQDNELRKYKIIKEKNSKGKE